MFILQFLFARWLNPISDALVSIGIAISGGRLCNIIKSITGAFPVYN